VIDLGPEGGGEIVAWGPPEDIVKAPSSYTGKFLAPALAKAGKANLVCGASQQVNCIKSPPLYDEQQTLKLVEWIDFDAVAAGYPGLSI
jgi:hypothetical protein